MELALTVIQVLAAVSLIALVLLQPGKSAGLSGAIAGGAETFFGKRKGLEQKLERFTAIVGAIFMITALVSVILG